MPSWATAFLHLEAGGREESQEKEQDEETVVKYKFFYWACPFTLAIISTFCFLLSSFLQSSWLLFLSLLSLPKGLYNLDNNLRTAELAATKWVVEFSFLFVSFLPSPQKHVCKQSTSLPLHSMKSSCLGGCLWADFVHLGSAQTPLPPPLCYKDLKLTFRGNWYL